MMIPQRGGLPHSDIHGSKPARGSPWLFAACHVLHRLLVPRHPPNALIALNRPTCTETSHSSRHEQIPKQTRPSEPVTLRSIYTRASDRFPQRLEQQARHKPPPPGQTNPRRGANQKRTNLFTCPKNTWIPDPTGPRRRLRASHGPHGTRSENPP